LGMILWEYFDISKKICNKTFGKNNFSTRNLANKLDDSDIGLMAGGGFKRNVFKYNGGGKIFVKYQSFLRNKGYIKVDIFFLPSIAKKVDIFFSMAPNIKDKCDFFIKDGNIDIAVNKHSKVIEKVSLQTDEHHFNCKYIEFRISYNEEFDEKLWQPSGLELLVKQFEI